MASKIFHDPIHGTIELEEKLVKIIDTPEFQRLRRIKQLGVNQYVYPGAVHTRFEHSIGVCYIAGELLKKLESEPTAKEIIETNKLNVLVAALCHDLGHGPFSHTYDCFVKEYNKEKNNLKEHEWRSANIVKKILSDLKFGGDVNIDMVEQLIVFSEIGKEVTERIGKEEDSEGKKQISKIEDEMIMKMKDNFKENKLDKRHMFLFEIVANGFSGIDVDKMDYFARDSHYVGLSQRFDWRRYIKTTCVKITESGSYRLCTQDKAIHMLDELFHTRYMLHITAYQHKTVIIIEQKLKDILKDGKKVVQIKGKDTWYDLDRCWIDMEAFQRLDDTVLELLKLAPLGSVTDTPQLKIDNEPPTLSGVKIGHKSATLSSQLQDLEKHTGFPKFVTKCGLKEEDAKKRVEQLKDCYAYSTFIERKFDYGLGSNDPICFHHFYSKLDDKPVTLKKDYVRKRLLRPDEFCKKVTFVYFDFERYKKDKQVTDEDVFSKMMSIKQKLDK